MYSLIWLRSVSLHLPVCFFFMCSIWFCSSFSISFYGRPASGPNTGWGHMAEWDQVPPIKNLPITSHGRDKEESACGPPWRTPHPLPPQEDHPLPLPQWTRSSWGWICAPPHALSQTQTSRTDTHAYNTELYFFPQTMFKVVKVIRCPRLDWITKFWR